MKKNFVLPSKEKAGRFIVMKIVQSFSIKTVLFMCACAFVMSIAPHSFAQVPKDIPEDIKVLLAKDPATLTDEEKAKILPLLIVPSIASPQATTPENMVNCFDYYKFGSVQVDLSPTLNQTLPGIPLTFVGKLKNSNPYPVVNGSVYVKIFKHDSADEGKTHQNGYPMVAFFEAGKDITIPASTEEDFTFDWQVPTTLSGGSYEADFFFVTDHRFNLLGLSFTDDITGNKTYFRISDETNTQVVFDKHTVTLNNEPYSFAAFPPHFGADEPVILSANIVNPGSTEKVISLTTKLYNWDGLRPEFLLDTKEEAITLSPNEKKNISYTATTHTGSVSYILMTLKDGDATSILNPRFVRDGVEELRLNFPSLYTYPLEAGKEATLFSCVHSTNLPLIENNTLIQTLTDTDTKEIIHTYTYKGGVTSAMMGVKDTFIPQYVPHRLTLTTVLAHNGIPFDTVSETYDCADLDPTSCPTERSKNIMNTTTPSANVPLMLISIASVPIVGVLGFILYRGYKKSIKNHYL